MLTSYVGAGILTRNEARVKLGEAPVSDPAANVLTVTGAAPTPVGQGSAELALAKHNPHHDEKGLFATADGARAGGKTHGVQVAQAQLAPAIAREIVTDAPAILGAGKAFLDWWNSSNHSSKPGDRTPSPPAPVERPAAASSPAIPPDDEPGDKEETKDNKTIRPSAEDIQKLVDEHSDKKGLKLTAEAANKILDETQPSGTKTTIVGKNVAGPDIVYEDANGARVTSVEVKTAKTLDRAEASVRDALRKEDKPDIVALQIRPDSDIPRLIGKLRNLDRLDTAGRSLVAVDPDGNILLKLQPFP